MSALLVCPEVFDDLGDASQNILSKPVARTAIPDFGWEFIGMTKCGSEMTLTTIGLVADQTCPQSKQELGLVEHVMND